MKCLFKNSHKYVLSTTTLKYNVNYAWTAELCRRQANLHKLIHNALLHNSRILNYNNYCIFNNYQYKCNWNNINTVTRNNNNNIQSNTIHSSATDLCVQHIVLFWYIGSTILSIKDVFNVVLQDFAVIFWMHMKTQKAQVQMIKSQKGLGLGLTLGFYQCSDIQLNVYSPITQTRDTAVIQQMHGRLPERPKPIYAGHPWL